MATFHLNLLGTFQAKLDGVEITASIPGKLRALLAYLATQPGTVFHRDTLAGFFWSDQPAEKALHSLRQSLSTLRKLLGDDNEQPFLALTSETVVFCQRPGVWLDVAAFRESLEAALRNYQPGKARCALHLRSLERALALYRGTFLDQLLITGAPLFEDWLMLERDSLERQAIEALTLLAHVYELRAEPTRARTALARLLQIAPWEENAHRQMMRLLAQGGQWSAAQAQFAACRRYLEHELAIEPAAETLALFEAIRSGLLILPDAPPPRISLPSYATPLIGREAELMELHGLLADPSQRLITLTGPGGIGKTRLAVEAAREQAGLFADGIFFISLATALTQDDCLLAIFERLGISYASAETSLAPQLMAYLREKSQLLILDNLEHLTSSSGWLPILITEIMKTAPECCILATSRERLGLHDEYLVTLIGLSYPIEKEPDGQSPESYGALSLFTTCARRQLRSFTLDLSVAPAVARICRLLEGLPLGLELAASALATRSCSQVAAELERSLDSIAVSSPDLPERHRSLRAAFDVSWRLLSITEQAVLARLAVFPGSFHPQAAFSVAGGTAEVLDRLINKSMLELATGDRCMLHPAVRSFALEKLVGNSQAAELTHLAHARFYLDFLFQQGLALKSSGQKDALALLAKENDNLREAWQKAAVLHLEGEMAMSAEALYLFLQGRGRYKEGCEWMGFASQHIPAGAALRRVLLYQAALGEKILPSADVQSILDHFEKLTEDGLSQEEAALASSVRASLASHRGDHHAALKLSNQAHDLYCQAVDGAGIAMALTQSGTALYHLGEIEPARQALEQAVMAARETHIDRLLIGPLNVLADVLCHLGEYSAARSLFEEALIISRDLDDLYHASVLLNNIGTVEQVLGKYSTALDCYLESQSLAHEIGDLSGEAIALSNQGEVLNLQGNYRHARLVTQKALAIGRQMKDHWAILACLNTLAEIGLEERSFLTAWGPLLEATRAAYQTQTYQMLARSLVTAGGLLLNTGQVEFGLRVLGAALRHPACQEDYLAKGQSWLARLGLTLPDITVSFEEIVPEVLRFAPGTIR